MKKIYSTKSTLLTGTLFLTLAGILTRIIGFFYRIFLSRTIGAEGLGIYQLIAPVTAICFAFTAAGIQTSISKFVSMEVGRKNDAGAKTYLSIGLFISLCLSTLCSFFLYHYADFIAVSWLGDKRCTPLLAVLSFSFIPCCIHACINGYYYGLKKTAVPSLCQLTEQFARVGSVYLMYQIAVSEGKSLTLSMVVWGIVCGEAASTLVSVSVFRISDGNRRTPGKSRKNLYTCTKHLLSMAVPLTSNRIVLNLFAGFENVMLPNRLLAFGYTQSEALSVYGILTGMAMSVIMFPSVITNSVSVLLLPTISEAQAAGKRNKILYTIKKTIESCLLLGFLSTAGFLVTGNFLGNFLFNNALAGTFIATLGWLCPFLYLSSTLSSILHGLGHPGITFELNLVSCTIRILFVLLAVPVWGIRSYLWGILVSQAVTALLSIFILLRKTAGYTFGRNNIKTQK